MSVVLDCEQIGTKKKKEKKKKESWKEIRSSRTRVCSTDLFVFILQHFFFCSCAMPLHSSNQPDDKIVLYTHIHEPFPYHKTYPIRKKRGAYLSSGNVKLKLRTIMVSSRCRHTSRCVCVHLWLILWRLLLITLALRNNWSVN